MENHLNLNSITEAAQSEGLRPLQMIPRSRSVDTAGAVGTAEPSDTAEFSDEARMLSLAAGSPEVGTDRIARVRAELQRDEQHFVRERLAATVECLCDELSSS